MSEAASRGWLKKAPGLGPTGAVGRLVWNQRWQHAYEMAFGSLQGGRRTTAPGIIRTAKIWDWRSACDR
jgi:hypothetical protein